MSTRPPPLFAKVLQERQTVRRFTGDPVAIPIIQRIVAAAGRAPSAHNRQPWRFCVLRDTPAKLALAGAMGIRLRSDREREGDDAQAIAADVARSHTRITSAPVVMVVCLTLEDMDAYQDRPRADAEWTMAVQSTAMAGAHVLLAAEAEGLGACWMCAPLFCPHEVREAIALPAHWMPQGLVLLGYPGEPGKSRSRKPVSEILSFR